MKFGLLQEVNDKTRKIRDFDQDFTLISFRVHPSLINLKKIPQRNVYLLKGVGAFAIETKAGMKTFLEDIDETMKNFDGLFLVSPALHWYKDEEDVRNKILERFVEIYRKLSNRYETFVVNTNKISEVWYTRGLGSSPFDNPEGLKNFEKIAIDTYRAAWNKDWNCFMLYKELKDKVKGFIVIDYLRENNRVREINLGKGELNLRILFNLDVEFFIFKEKDFKRGVKLWKSLSKH